MYLKKKKKAKSNQIAQSDAKAITSHQLTAADPAPEQQPLRKLTLLSMALDVMEYSWDQLGGVGVRCPGCILSQTLAHPQPPRWGAV